MQAQIVLTPTESKKMIARAVLQLPRVQRALQEGILVIHPSSSTIFIYQELFGEYPEGLWVCGAVAPHGLTGSKQAEEMIRTRGSGPHDPRKVSRQAWFIRKGILQPPTPLGDILDQMGEGDVYIKGVNAVDSEGNAGVLFANPHGGGGTIGKVLTAQKEKKFDILLPAGLEKLILGSVINACHAADRKAALPMGLPCGLYPVKGEIINEIDAIGILSGAKAAQLAAGGLGGAEGAVILAIDGEDSQVGQANKEVRLVKGAMLPKLEFAGANNWE